MEHAIVDVTVHLDEELPPDEQCKLEDFVRDQDGVVSAGISMIHPHLMMVAYDLERIKAGHILQQIQGRGLHAELIGL
ncbi:MAG: hypothetical protein ACLPXB_14110 [Thiobacillaceae bacterium]